MWCVRGRQSKVGAAAASSRPAPVKPDVGKKNTPTPDVGKKNTPEPTITWMQNEFIKEDQPVYAVVLSVL